MIVDPTGWSLNQWFGVYTLGMWVCVGLFALLVYWWGGSE